MTMDRRQAGAYLHGTVVVVPVSVAAWLDSQIDLQRLRPQARADGMQTFAVLHALLVAAHYARPTSARGRKALGASAEAAPPSEVMSTDQAADLLGIGSRAVRLACAEGRLPAQQVDGRWRIDRSDVNAYRSTTKGPR